MRVLGDALHQQDGFAPFAFEVLGDLDIGGRALHLSGTAAGQLAAGCPIAAAGSARRSEPTIAGATFGRWQETVAAYASTMSLRKTRGVGHCGPGGRRGRRGDGPRPKRISR
ncbi:hypothetical protein BST17_13960 [Mycolicibacterium bacteremicum]|uniref:Uncharacterized protein n=1 Tax=Mycolicibacterium bacteremicum TaxID=564198 RepID=A0A1W9YWF2_MYCBA|nr:hypothetical protein BST17_13960 [Mycolicibacterium bacteremicum]